jgi:peroxiredoxin
MLSPGSLAPQFLELTEILPRGPVLLAFFKISCPVCQLTLPFLNGLKSPVLAISQDDEASTRRFLTKFGIPSLPILLDRADDGYPISNTFGITHVPTLFKVEIDGTISSVSEGFVKADLESFGVVFDQAVPAWKAG